jgi:hypothetical protein
MDYITKINDFKKVFSEIINPENNKYKAIVVDALFDNVKINYEEYKDSFEGISVRYDPYKYHILQPINGYYSLLDFLLNRAISNLEKIEITSTDDSHSNHFEIYIGENRYKELANKKGNDIANKHFKKSCYHEALHSLHAKFRFGQDGFYSNNSDYYKRKVELFYKKLGNTYSNIINPRKLTNVPCLNRGTSLSKPFFPSSGYSETASLAFDELATEAEAIINSRLIYSEDVDYIYCGTNHVKLVPNYECGYARYQTFMIQLKSLVPKEDYFDSLFFHNNSAIKAFARKYKSEIRLRSTRYGYDCNRDPLDILWDLFSKVCPSFFYYNKETNIDNNLYSIFISAYQKEIQRVDSLDTETLLRYKEALAFSYNQAHMKVDEKGNVEDTNHKKEYLRLFNIVCGELDKRNVKHTTR